jgi:sugar lactone lactonase YvrE
VDNHIFYVTATLPARLTGTITPPAGATMTFAPPPPLSIAVRWLPKAFSRPLPSIVSLVGDPATNRMLILDGLHQRLWEFDWGAEGAILPGPSNPGAKLTLVAVTGAGRWLVADDGGRVSRSDGKGGWELLTTVPGGLRAMTAAADVVHAIDGAGQYGTVVGGAFVAAVTQPPGGLGGAAAIAVDAQSGVWISDIAGKRLLSGGSGTPGWTDEVPAASDALSAPGALCVAPDGTLWVVNQGSETLVRRAPNGWWSPVAHPIGAFSFTGTAPFTSAAGLYVDAQDTAWGGACGLLRLVGPVSLIGGGQAYALWQRGGRYAVIPAITMLMPWQGEVMAPFTLTSPADVNAPPVPVQLRFGFGVVARPVGPPRCSAVRAVTFPGVPVGLAMSGVADAGGPLGFAWTAPKLGEAMTAPGDDSGRLIVYHPPSTVPSAGLTDTFEVQAVEGAMRSASATVTVEVVTPPSVSVAVPTRGAVVVPAPGPLGPASNRILDTSALGCRTYAWWGLDRPGDVAYDPTTETLWVTTPDDYRQALWRKPLSGDPTPYGRAAGLVDLQRVVGVAAFRGAVWVADGERPLLWKRDPRNGVWTSITVLGNRVPGGLAQYFGIVYLTIPADGSVVAIEPGTGKQWLAAPARVANLGGDLLDVRPVGRGLNARPLAPSDVPASPQAIATDGQGTIWVTNHGDARIYRWNGIWRAFDASTSSIGAVRSPGGLALDANGALWVADPEAMRVVTLTVVGDTPQWALSRVDNLPGELRQPTRVAVDPTGAVWVSDVGSGRLLKFACLQQADGFEVEVRADGSLLCMDRSASDSASTTVSLPSICSVPGAPPIALAATPLSVRLTSAP